MATHASIPAWKKIPWTKNLVGTVHGVTKVLDTTEHAWTCNHKK